MRAVIQINDVYILSKPVSLRVDRRKLDEKCSLLLLPVHQVKCPTKIIKKLKDIFVCEEIYPDVSILYRLKCFLKLKHLR